MSIALGALITLLAICVIGAVGWCWLVRRALRGDVDINR